MTENRYEKHCPCTVSELREFRKLGEIEGTILEEAAAAKETLERNQWILTAEKSGLLRLAGMMGFFGAEQMETEDETIAALLHDVIEDTDIGFDYLKKEGFSDTVINCLKILTKDPNEDYMDYIRKIKKTGGIALKIKKADMAHNMIAERISKKIQSDESRMEKYRAAFDILNCQNT